MAAKPPKPPGSFLKSNKDNNKNDSSHSVVSHTTAATNLKTNPSNDNFHSICATNINNNNKSNENASAINGDNVVENVNNTKTTNCNCTNISIMHLFHEMKQKFPTIPDQIVAECVSENCHQRDNCIQKLSNELALHPIPVQTYPAKIVSTRSKPPTPSKPIRTIQNFNHSNNNIKNCVDNIDCVVNNSDMHILTTNPINNDNTAYKYDSVSAMQKKQNFNNPNTTGEASACLPRVRPTTLNLQTSSQKQQQQIQIQNHQQQQQQPQQQQQQQKQLNIQLQQRAQPIRPLRKAPQPPLPPKPTLLNQNCFNSPHQLQKKHDANVLTQSQQSSFSNESSSSCLTSPISSAESEISVNVSLSSPTSATSSAARTQQYPAIRHRAVITVQPEPPYTRDFLRSPTSSTSSGKSFTSVNLTLRQPNVNSAGLLPSTIDISAGPVVTGSGSSGGSGLTYSSTSYDSRLGFKQNFHISVTDEGSVVSASSLRPSRVHFQADGQQQPDDFKANSGSSSNVVNSVYQSADENTLNKLEKPEQQQQFHPLQLRFSDLQQQEKAQQQQQQQQNEKQNQNQNIFSLNAKIDEEMCCKTEANGVAEKIQKQKQCRDNLASQLRKNKNELNNLQQEIHILYEPVETGQVERLDIEIENLRRDCQVLSAQLSALPPTTTTAASLSSSSAATSLTTATTQQPQPFPRQRTSRLTQQTNSAASPTAATRRPSLDFLQHHSSAATTPIQQRSPIATVEDDTYYTDSQSEADDDDEEEILEQWACNLCTFRNHPQLNICEACDNVRILPEPLFSRENIQITLSPGENRIIHSWILS